MTETKRNPKIVSALVDRCMLDNVQQAQEQEAEFWTFLVEDLAEDLLRDISGHDAETHDLHRHFDPTEWPDANRQHPKGTTDREYLEWLNFHHDGVKRDLEIERECAKDKEKALTVAAERISLVGDIACEMARCAALDLPYGPSLLELLDAIENLPCNLKEIATGDATEVF